MRRCNTCETSCPDDFWGSWVGSSCGICNNWISGAQNNGLFYHRPSDDKMFFFLHDVSLRLTGR